jgi:hypothetical protein
MHGHGSGDIPEHWRTPGPRPCGCWPWSGFGGRWGETEYFFTPVAIPTAPPFPAVPANTALPVGVAPASPANQDNWNVAKVLAWPS